MRILHLLIKKDVFVISHIIFGDVSLKKIFLRCLITTPLFIIKRFIEYTKNTFQIQSKFLVKWLLGTFEQGEIIRVLFFIFVYRTLIIIITLTKLLTWAEIKLILQIDFTNI